MADFTYRESVTPAGTGCKAAVAAQAAPAQLFHAGITLAALLAVDGIALAGLDKFSLASPSRLLR